MLLALLLLLVATPASAATAFMQPATSIVSTGISTDSRTVYLCFLPDTQNQMSQDDEIAPDRASAISSCEPVQAATNCSGNYCAKSPYCDTHWINTGRIKMQNTAAELTGRWNDIDWTQIQGTDNVRSHLAGPLDHPRCDAIISLGDMIDIDDSGGFVSTIHSLTDLITLAGFQNGIEQYRTNLAFWTAIRDSGIPFLPVPGNHDPEDLMPQLFSDLGFTSLPFYYDTAPSGKSAAIKFATRTGKSFCVISTAYNTRAKADLEWRTDKIGCGSGLPTIFVSHYAVFGSGGSAGRYIDELADAATSKCIQNALADAAKSALFMIVGGHETSVPSVKHFTASGGTLNSSSPQCTNVASTYAYSWFGLYTDPQELNTHNSNVNLPYGNTPSDGNAMQYTIVAINPIAKTVDAWDWSPYWQTNNGEAPTDAPGTTATRLHQSFDFDSRFP